MAEHVLSLSYGKDSLACLGAIEQLGWPLDRIVHTEVWATDTIPADLPPMAAFKARADKVIMERWGIEVEHYCAERNGRRQSYEDVFYRKVSDGALERRKLNPNFRPVGRLEIYGFPAALKGSWCVSEIKVDPLKKHRDREDVTYLGIAADEDERSHILSPAYRSPLIELGWSEADCRKWCEDNDLLSPIYASSSRGGCWFCHNQSVGQLRSLRQKYPELWSLMLKWDMDSPVSFRPDGHTVFDFDRRFQMEDEGYIVPGEPFRWKMLDAELNVRFF